MAYIKKLVNPITAEILKESSTEHKTLEVARKACNRFLRRGLGGLSNPVYHKQIHITDTATGEVVARLVEIELRKDHKYIAVINGFEVEFANRYVERRLTWASVDEETALKLAQASYALTLLPESAAAAERAA